MQTILQITTFYFGEGLVRKKRFGIVMYVIAVRYDGLEWIPDEEYSVAIKLVDTGVQCVFGNAVLRHIYKISQPREVVRLFQKSATTITREEVTGDIIPYK